MMVCDSSEQAKEIYRQFQENYPELNSALILHDIGTKDDRDELSEDFKRGAIDILIVYNMLLTGFDAPRLKKLYFCRVVRDHNLLQALTRVNRPYGKFRFGYVVDFADITDEFNKTNAAYFAELTSNMGEEGASYSNLFVSEDEIRKNILKIKNELFMYDLANAEIFSQQISKINDKHKMREIVSCLEMARETYNLIRTLGYKELADKLDFEKLKLLYIESNNRLNIILLKERIEISEETRALLNSALEELQFNFEKVGEQELEIGSRLRNNIREVREALARNFDHKDPEFTYLYDELIRILKKHNIAESSDNSAKADVIQLENILKQARDLNNRNQNLAHKYEGDFKFARIHKLLIRNSPQLTDSQIHQFLNVLRIALNDLVSNNEEILNNGEYFEKEIRLHITNIFDFNEELERYIDKNELRIHIANEFFAEIDERSIA
jgi:type I restriction enzyme R subunit